MHPTTGGYVLTLDPLVRFAGEQHTAELDRPVSELDLKALNAVQATPWRINRAICETMGAAWDLCRWQGAMFPGIETGVAGPMPARMDDAMWASLTPEARKENSKARAKAHDANASTTGRTFAFMDKLQVAQELVDRDAIYYPHTRCFRGRIYPLAVTGPHPQGNDVAKALLEFARGAPLGEDGLYWLCVRAANCFGMGKMPLEERVGWTLAHMEDIGFAARTPLSDLWWRKASEPWSFLATCMELSAAYDMGGAANEFISHLPIPLDGSCNGLQHLSAMALDPVGAQATNLRSGFPRQDIYADIAAHVSEAVQRGAADAVPEAVTWLGRVTRDVVKRAVMTTPLT